MIINAFNGGINNRLDPSLLRSNEAVELINVDTTSNALVSHKDYLFDGSEARGYFYLFQDRWVNSYLERSYVEYNNKLYFTEALGKPQKFDGTTTKNLGIERPINAPLIAIAGGGSPVIPVGTWQYVYTYYNSIDDVESAPSEVSAELVLASISRINITNLLPSPDPQVDKIRVYRIGPDITEFLMVVELPATSTTYTDNIATTDLTRVLDSQNNAPALLGAKYLIEAYGIFFYAIDSKVYFSLQGKPDYWPSEQYILFNRPVTGLLLSSEGVLVFGANRVDIIYGTKVQEFLKREVTSNIGCVSHYSGKTVKGRPIWLSNEGFCTVSNGVVTNVSRASLGKQTFSIVNTAIYDDTYWVCLTDGSLLCIDYRFGDFGDFAFKKYTLTKPLVNIYADGTLFGVVDGDKLVKLFEGGYLSFHYTSPVFIEESYAETKLYNNIYVKFNGTFTFQVLIDGAFVASYALTGDSYKELNVPEEKQRGNSIQFDITGTGTIHEIEYKVQGRQNGR